jgi:hypothetical protein
MLTLAPTELSYDDACSCQDSIFSLVPPASSQWTSPRNRATRAHCLLSPSPTPDAGMDLASDKKREVDAMLEQLEAMGAAAAVEPLDDPQLFGTFDVSYVSSGAGQKVRGARGGRGGAAHAGWAWVRVRCGPLMHVHAHTALLYAETRGCCETAGLQRVQTSTCPVS